MKRKRKKPFKHFLMHHKVQNMGIDPFFPLLHITFREKQKCLKRLSKGLNLT